MIETVITQIVDAEAKAEQIIAHANSQAKDISLSLHGETENLKKEYAQLIKELVTARLKAAEAEADKLCLEQAKLAEVSAANIVKNSDKNVQRTVEWLADLIIKQNA